MQLIGLLVQAAPEPFPPFVQAIIDFLDTPAPYSPFSEYLCIMLLLWLLARRDQNRNTFDNKAQQVLDEKLASGEIDKRTYDKYRQEVTAKSQTNK